MTIYVFGNEDNTIDNLAPKIATGMANTSDIKFEFIPPNGDIPTPKNKVVNILDTVFGIDNVTLITERELDKLIPSPRTTAHDYDLSFQLKYLIKIGMLEKVNIVGLPAEHKPDYDLIHSIFKKLVAQDIQGS